MKNTSRLILLMAALTLLGFSCSRPTTKTNQATTNTVANTNTTYINSNTGSNTFVQSPILWQNTGSGWESVGSAPACPNPLVLQTPVDLSIVSSALYPGQTRSGQYKPHGGFRFDNTASDGVTVLAPMDAYVTSASRYIEGGEVQYLFTFTAPCGIMYRFDHLLTLSPAMQAIANTLPEAKVDDSRTINISPPVAVKSGDIIATAVGFEQTSNVFVDFGVYDLRQKNTASQNADWAATHDPELAQHALCWFSLLSEADEARMRALPAGDSTSGKTSDYCS